MNISTKLFTGLIIISLFLISILVTSYVFDDKINSKSMLLNKVYTNNTLKFLDVRRDVIQIQQWYTDISLTKGLDGLNTGFREAEKYYSSSQVLLNELIKSNNNGKFLNKIQNIKEQINKYYDLGKTMAQKYLEKDNAKGNLLMKELDSFAEKLTMDIDKLVIKEKKHTNLLLNQIADLTKLKKNINIVIIGIGIFIIVLLSVFTIHDIKKPLKTVVFALKNISEGENDLTKTISYNSKNEMGQLSNYFNKFLNKLELTINTIKNSFGKSQDVGDNLLSYSEKVSATLIEINNNVKSVNESFIHLDDNINNLVKAIDNNYVSIKNLTEKVETQASAVTESSSSITQMIKSIQSVAQIAQDKKVSTKNLLDITKIGGKKLEETDIIIKNISETSEEILAMINIINGIAIKTNLLAMNAAIEAAHAGQAGKGFAVVADEIRKLAVSTANNTKNISETLKNNFENIQLVSGLSNESKAAFNNITKEVHDVTRDLEEVSDHMLELSTGSNEILKAISNLYDITESIRTNSSQMKQAIGESNEAVHNIQNISIDTLDSITKIAKNVSEMKTEAITIAKLGQENTENINLLNFEVKKFKTNHSSMSAKNELINYDDQLLTVPLFVTWNDSLNINIDIVDNQHKKLIDYINKLHANMKMGRAFKVMSKIIEGLVDYTVTHFTSEEKLMLDNKYPNYKDHKSQHVKFVEQMTEFKGKFFKKEVGLTPEVLDFLQDWLVNHIKGSDKLFGSYLKKNI
ncbi:MAG: bacteriohemerythrin [Spirochaetota bacterium]|nr:bacteriohemerythrin [Spirochaetota bacterium]